MSSATGSVLQQKIRAFVEEKRMPLAAFEREAGLKTNVARNILRGDSKRPTGETLQAIANYMNCTIQELMGEKPSSSIPRSVKPSIFSAALEHPALLIQALQAVTKIASESGFSLQIHQALSMAEEAYNYGLKKKPPQIDADFVRWLFEKTGG